MPSSVALLHSLFSALFDEYCKIHYGDGHCDYGCDNAECNWDGLDCDTVPPNLADGAISVVLLMDMQTFRQNLVQFLREVSARIARYSVGCRAEVECAEMTDDSNFIVCADGTPVASHPTRETGCD